MDEAGNILIKRISKSNVYIKITVPDDENAIGNEILKLPGCALEPEKPVKVNKNINYLHCTKFCFCCYLLRQILFYLAIRYEKVPI